jgi:hypothetical protein
VTDTFTTPDDGGDLKSSDFSTGVLEQEGSRLTQGFLNNPLPQLVRQARLAHAGGEDLAVGAGGDVDVFSGTSLEDQQAVLDRQKAAIPDVSKEDAKALLKQEGLSESEVPLGAADSHKLPVLQMRIDDAHAKRDREAAIERGPQGFFPGALGLVTSLGVGMLDPINDAAFSIPVIGEARMGKILASAGDSILARAGVRVGEGAVKGAAGTAALTPLDWWFHTRDGQDYTMAEAMHSIVMGAGMGAAFHALPGTYRDWRTRRQGLPLEGGPQDLVLRGLMIGTHVPASALAEDGVPLDEVPGISGVAAPEPPGAQPSPLHPGEVIADLPPAAREDVVHAAMAGIIHGEPVQAAELLKIAADHDPRIAESVDPYFEAWHGSPYDFERFDASKLGTGEGAQSYGHGLYFAENEKVARQYKRTTSDKAFIDKVSQLYDEGFSPDDAWAEIKDHWSDFSPGEQRLMTALEKDDWLGFDYPHQAVSAALREIKAFDVSPETAAAAHAIGNMYHVKIGVPHEHLLDWDEKLSEQSPHVRAAIEKLVAEHGNRDWVESRNGGAVDARVTQIEAALRESPSDGSDVDNARVAKLHRELEELQGEGTRNFVIFDDKHIEITHKNGEPVERAELRAERERRAAQDRADAAAATTTHVAPKTARGRAAADPATWSLFEYLASKGGLKPDPELEAIFGSKKGPMVSGFGPLVRKSGMSLDEALRSAKDGHYLFDAADVTGVEASLTPRDLLDKINEQNRGRKVYQINHISPDREISAEEDYQHISGALHDELEASSGQKGIEIPAEIERRVVEIIRHEGEHDVLAAYERAIIEDEERYEAAVNARAESENPVDRTIPGWDVPVDAGTAPRGSAALETDRGPAERAGPANGRSAGGPARAIGPGDRAPGPAQLKSSPAVAAADPRWRELANVKQDYDDPDVVAESEAAAKLPEPDSVQDPQKSLTALEKAAADAEEVWRALEPTLTEAERALVNDVMDKLKLDADTRAKVISEGAVCLAGAFT